MKKNIVLFVDDEAQVLSAIKRSVADEHFTSLFATSGQEALAIMAKENISVLVTDMRMPVMDGLMLLKQAKISYPTTVRMVLSGFTQLSQMLVTINQGDIFKFITKPWKMEDELLHSVRQAIEYHNFQCYNEEVQKTTQKRNIVYQNVLKMMESKVHVIKRDLDNIRNLDQWMFRFVKYKTEAMHKQAVYNPKKFLEELDSLGELHLSYLDTLPTSFVSFDQKAIIKSLDEFIAIRQYESRWKLNIKNTLESICSGNYKILLLVAQTLIDYLMQLGTVSKLYCQIESGEITEIETETEIETVSVKFNISIIAFVGEKETRMMDAEKLYVVAALFNEICAVDNIHVVLHDRETEVLFIIQSKFPLLKEENNIEHGEMTLV